MDGRAHARGPPAAGPESGATGVAANVARLTGPAGDPAVVGHRGRRRGLFHARSDGYLLWRRWPVVAALVGCDPHPEADPLLIISARCCSSMSGLRSGAGLTCMTQFGHKAVWPVPPQTAQSLRKIQDRVFPVPSHRRQVSMRRPVPHTAYVRRFRRFPLIQPLPRSGSLIVNLLGGFCFWLYRLESASAGSNLSQSIVPPDRNKCQHIRQAARGRAWRSGSLRYRAIRRRGPAAPQRPTGARESCRRLDALSWSSSKR